jgi:hypothetical protein
MFNGGTRERVPKKRTRRLYRKDLQPILKLLLNPYSQKAHQGYKPDKGAKEPGKNSRQNSKLSVDLE